MDRADDPNVVGNDQAPIGQPEQETFLKVCADISDGVLVVAENAFLEKLLHDVGVIRAFMAVAPLQMQRALILALHTGQRLSDLLRAAWTNYDGKTLRIRQSKGNVVVAIPCTRALRGMLDAMPRDATVILTSVTGKAWKKRHFSDQWKEASDAAGLQDLHFHDLRGTAITMLAEAGCTVPEIASITGHSLKTVTTILEKYLSRTAALAEAAIEKFENAAATDFANRLQTGRTADPNG